MCRWIVYLSDEPAYVADIISRPQHSLLKQIDVHYLPGIKKSDHPSDNGSANAFTNVDGFGIGWYSTVESKYAPLETPFREDSKGKLLALPVVFRTCESPINNANLKAITLGTESSCIFGHVRAGAPVVETNNHPFRFGRYLFQHNGTVHKFFEIKTALLGRLSVAAHRLITGTTDTEHVAALFFSLLEPDGPWHRSYPREKLVATLQKTVETLQELITNVGGYGPGEWSSMNFAITDGEQLMALRFAYPPERDAPSLYWSTRAGPTLNRRYEDHPDGLGAGRDGKELAEKHQPHIVVASEPTTYRKEDWVLMESGQIVFVGPEDLAGRKAGEAWEPRSFRLTG